MKDDDESLGVRRSIDAYEKEGIGYFVFSYPLSGVPLSFLQKLFNVDPNDLDLGMVHMIDQYDINEEQAKALRPYVDGEIDLEKYDFELGCCKR